MYKHLKLLLISGILIILSGCTNTIQYITPPKESLLVPKDKVRIIVERADAFILSGISHQLIDNGTVVGILGNGGVLKWERDLSNLHLIGKKYEGAYDIKIGSDAYGVIGGETYHFYIDLSELSPDAHKLKLRSGVTKTISKSSQIDINTTQKENFAEEIIQYESTNNLEGLKQFTEKYPQSALLIKDPLLRLTLIGPKEMKIGDILKHLKNGKSEIILISLIKQQEIPYTKFTIEEVEMLTKMGLSDLIIATIIDTTTQLLRDEKLQAEQERYLSIQQNTIPPQTPIIQKSQNESDTIMNEVSKEVTKQGIKFLLDQLF